MEELNDQELVRREKLEKLKELGVDPYGSKFERTDTTKSCREKVLNKTNEELNENSPFVYTALEFATDVFAVKELLKSNNQTLILKTTEILKSLNALDETAKTVALLKVTDINIKAIIRSL